MPQFQRHALFHDMHRHARMAAQQRIHHGLMAGREVLNNHKGRGQRLINGAEKPIQCL